MFLATTYPNTTEPLNRLMLAQDTGGAIRGVVRADFFWGSGNEAGALAGELAPILQRQMPRLPVAVHLVGLAPLNDDLAAARLVVLPLDLATRPPEALRLWLQGFSGKRILVPVAVENWVWLGTQGRTLRELAQAAAQAVRQVAEGQPVKPPTPNSPWVIAGYILAGLFGLEILLVVFTLLMSLVGM